METNLKKILIIDDEERVCEMLRTIFKDDENIQVLTALNGQEGLSLVKKQKPETVLLDVNMPGLDGIEVLKQIKELYPQTEVIMVTAEKIPARLEEAKRFGASYYITKPFVIKQLKEIVKGLSVIKPKKAALQPKFLLPKSDLLEIAYTTLRMLNRLKNPLVLVRKVVEYTVNKFGFIHASVLLYERKEDSYVLVESGGKAKIPRDLVRWSSESELIRFFADRTRYPSVDRKILTTTGIEDLLKNKGLLKSEKGLFDTLLEIKEDMKNLRNSQICIPAYVRHSFMGLLLGTRPQGKEFNDEEKAFLTFLAEDIAVAIEKAQLIQDKSRALRDLEEVNQELKKRTMQTLHTLAKAIDARDKYTIEHSLRVTDYCLVIAEELGLSKEKIETLKVAAEFHDLGKVGLPDSIIKGEHRLTEEEYKIVKTHPLIGEEILNLFDYLVPHRQIMRYHHERFDGQGYPEGLKGEEIPIEARIMALADVLDVLFSGRIYQKAFQFKKAVQEIIKSTYYQSPQFDPQVVEAFLKAVVKGKIKGYILTDKEIEQIRKEAQEDAKRERRIISLIAEEFSLEEGKITAKTKLIDDLRAVPKDIAILIKRLEKEFGIEISSKDAKEIESVKDIVLYINEKLKEAKICSQQPVKPNKAT